MADYEHSTTATKLGALPEPLRSAATSRAAALQLTVPNDSPAYLTRSRRLKKPGLLSRITGSADKDTEHFTAVVLGPRDVLVATHGEHRRTVVLTGRLEDVTSRPLADHWAMYSDDGIEISGVAVDPGSGGRVYSLFGVGPPDGAAARNALEAAIRTAKA